MEMTLMPKEIFVEVVTLMPKESSVEMVTWKFLKVKENVTS